MSAHIEMHPPRPDLPTFNQLFYNRPCLFLLVASNSSFSCSDPQSKLCPVVRIPLTRELKFSIEARTSEREKARKDDERQIADPGSTDEGDVAVVVMLYSELDEMTGNVGAA